MVIVGWAAQWGGLDRLAHTGPGAEFLYLGNLCCLQLWLEVPKAGQAGLFAESKQYHCLARAKYRGRSKVQIQAYLCAIVQNLKRGTASVAGSRTESFALIQGAMILAGLGLASSVPNAVNAAVIVIVLAAVMSGGTQCAGGRADGHHITGYDHRGEVRRQSTSLTRQASLPCPWRRS